MSETKQPIWKFSTNLGDANPIKEGGFFVYEDETGVYPPEAELLTPRQGDWVIHRIVLEECFWDDKTKVLSDNKFHKDKPAWFADKLRNVADSYGIITSELIKMFCSPEAIHRALAWRMVGEYFGWENLDSYPLVLTDKQAVVERYTQGELD